MIKKAELNQFGKVGGMQPNEPNKTDLCDDGVMKIIYISQMILSEEDGMKVSFNVIKTNI